VSLLVWSDNKMQPFDYSLSNHLKYFPGPVNVMNLIMHPLKEVSR